MRLARWIPIAVLCVVLPAFVAGAARTPEALNTPQMVLYDMQPPNDATPASSPSPGNVGAHLSYNQPPPYTGFLQEWGAVVLDQSNLVAANTRVEVKNFESYVWSNSAGRWVRAQASRRPNGAYFQFSSSGPTTAPIVWRPEPDGGESAVFKKGWVIHFFGAPRWTLPASGAGSQKDIGGTFTTYQARLIKDSASGPDNTATARFLAQSGGDWWPLSGHKLGANPQGNVGIGSGRWGYLTAGWQAVSFYTGGPSSVIAAASTKFPGLAWSETRLLGSPPPMDGLGGP